MTILKNYFSKLSQIIKAHILLYFALTVLSAGFIFRMGNVAFFTHSKITIDWVVFVLIALFVLSYILQSLLLQKKCYP